MRWPFDKLRRQKEMELDEEIRSHLAMAEADRRREGETGTAARLSAKREFGNEGLVREVTREIWGWTAVERVIQDVRYSLRSIRRNPGFAVTAILALGLGVGVNTATFSMSDALLLRPMPVRDPSRVVAVSGVSAQSSAEPLSYPDFVDLRSRSQSFEAMAGFRLVRLALASSREETPRMTMGMMVSSGFFDLLGLRPALGRWLTAEETGSRGKGSSVVLGYAFWRDHYGSNPDILGRSLRLNGLNFNIVGVAPESFTGMDIRMRPSMYLPLLMTDELSGVRPPSSLDQRDSASLTVRARLKEGVSSAQAQQELAALGAALEREFADTNRSRTFVVRTDIAARLQESWTTGVLVAGLMVLAGLVILIACANVANLLLARARARSREVCIRLAIGAGRIRLLKQLLTESLVLSGFGGLAGVAFAFAGIRYLSAIQLPTDTPIVIGVKLDGRVLLFALAASVASAILFGLAPALQTVRADLVTALKSGGILVGRERWRNAGRSGLVITQLALSLVLMVASAGLFDAFRRMLVIDPGIRTNQRMMVELDAALLHYSDQQARDFYGRLLGEVRSLPEVESATLARAIPFRPNFSDETIVPEGYQPPADRSGRRSASVIVASNVVDDQYFRTMGVRLTSGRAFTPQDREGTRRVAIVNEEFARRYWPGQSAVGKRIGMGGNGTTAEVVGVTVTGKYLSLAEKPTPYFYLPLSQNARPRMTLLVETRGAPGMVVPPVLRIVKSLDANLPAFNVRSLEDYYEQGVLGPARIILQMVAVTGFVGVALSVVGLYGLVAYSVSRRTREFGIRMAVGAGRSSVVRMVLGEGLRTTGIGLAAGMLLSIPVFRLMSTGLAGVGELNPWTLVLVPLLLCGAMLCACYFPAFRASRIDPTKALRYD